MEKLAETLDADTLGAEDLSPDETNSATDDHVEVKEAAKDTAPEEAGRNEHFPGGDELALELLSLEILEQEIGAAA